MPLAPQSRWDHGSDHGVRSDYGVCVLVNKCGSGDWLSRISIAGEQGELPKNLKGRIENEKIRSRRA